MDLDGRLPLVLLTTGLVVLIAGVPVSILYADPLVELPWFAGAAVFLATAAYVWRRMPDQTIARWFAVTGGLVAIAQTTNPIMEIFLVLDHDAGLAWAAFAFHVTVILTVVSLAHLLGLFPHGRIDRAYERRTLRASWSLLLLPPLVLVGSPSVQLPTYVVAPEIASPYHLPALTALGEAAGTGIVLAQGVFAVGIVLLALRYRRADRPLRRRIRWLLLPTIFAAGVATFDLLLWRAFPAGPPSVTGYVALTALWVAVMASVPLAIAVALLRPGLVDVDRMIRRSLVYGSLWVVIVLTYVAAAAGLGIVAGQRLPVAVAIVITVGATLLFQPARRHLERLADRWVFGPRTDPAQLVSRLGDTLARTFELESLLPLMATTLEEGLGLDWARVRLEGEPAGQEEPALTVPIVLGDERLGTVECGPKASGSFTPEDEEVVRTFGRQAALAVRNLRLTTALTVQARELAGSRARLVQAQETERRRIERNIHDGAQQDLIALIAQAGRARTVVATDPQAAVAVIAELQAGLARVLTELRALARGIHPSILSDRGLLEAVEALAARSVVPVEVRADPSLRAERFPEAIEGAAYFTVAEALANVGKHSGATLAQVALARRNGTLVIAVRDDGVGFDPATASGDGLNNLAARVAALGGDLDIGTRPGRGTAVTARLGAGGDGAVDA